MLALIMAGYFLLAGLQPAAHAATGAGAPVEGHWRLQEVIEDPHARSEPDWASQAAGARQTYTYASPGEIAYRHRLVGTGVEWWLEGGFQYSSPPEALIPGDTLTLSSRAFISRFENWADHLNPMIGGSIGLEGVSGIENAWAPARIRARTQREGERAQNSVEIAVPARPGTGPQVWSRSVRVVANAGARRIYVYQWVEGPPDPDAGLTTASAALPPPPPRPHPAQADDRPRDDLPPLPVVTYTRGQVFFNSGDGWLPLRSGAALPHGSSIRTGPDSIAEIVFFNLQLVRLRPGSLITVPTHDGPAERGGVLVMTIGKIWSRVTRGSRFEVESSSAIAGVRGTRFSVEIMADGRERFAVYSGALDVRIRALDDIVALEAGGWLAIAADGSSLETGALNALERAEERVWHANDPDRALPAPADGQLVRDAREGPWRYQVWFAQHALHGLLFLDDDAVGALEDELDTPFGRMRWREGAGMGHGWHPVPY